MDSSETVQNASTGVEDDQVQIAKINAKLACINPLDRFYGTPLIDCVREGTMDIHAVLTKWNDALQAELAALGEAPPAAAGPAAEAEAPTMMASAARPPASSSPNSMMVAGELGNKALLTQFSSLRRWLQPYEEALQPRDRSLYVHSIGCYISCSLQSPRTMSRSRDRCYEYVRALCLTFPTKI